MTGLATSEFTAVINTAVNWQVIIWMSVHTRVCMWMNMCVLSIVYHSDAGGSNAREWQFGQERDQVHSSQMIQGTDWHHRLQ